MKIEFLYFEGCPNHEQALSNLKEVLTEAGVRDENEIINIEKPEDATEYRFLGSPSIRINGKDLEITENESTVYSMRCRRYRNGDEMQGFPSIGLIRMKLSSSQGD